MKRILVVDDDRFERTALRAVLARGGFEVVTAANGEEALEHLAAGPAPDLVLLDLIMPKVSGFEVLRRMQDIPGHADIPVLVLSHLGHDADMARAMGAGASGYLVKSGLSLKDLVERVRHTLKEGVA